MVSSHEEDSASVARVAIVGALGVLIVGNEVDLTHSRVPLAKHASKIGTCSAAWPAGGSVIATCKSSSPIPHS